MTVTVSRLYDTYAQAQDAVRGLENIGIPHADISIVSNNADNWYQGADGVSGRVDRDRDRDGADDRAEGAATGAGVGAAIGGAAGLLAGLGLLAIPGLGPVVAAGWLASTAVGALAGGTSGGVIGALTQSGVSEEDAHVYAEGVRRGGSLVSARVPDADRTRAEALLDRASVDIGQRRKYYQKGGWKGFDAAAPGYSAEKIRQERDAIQQARW